MSDAIGEILWQPSSERIAASHMAAFATEAGFAPADHAALHAWSVAEPAAFYDLLWDFLGIIGDKGPRSVALDADIRKTKFYPGARLNYAENILADPDDRPAIIAHRDDGTRRTLTRRELYDLVSRAVSALRAEGVARGDRIGGIVTNDIEAVVLYLAAAAIGAIWASCSPDFGPGGAADRLNQLAPKLLFAVPTYSYSGKTIDTTASINAVAAADSIQRVVLLGTPPAGAAYGKPATNWDDWLPPHAAGPIAFEPLPFDTPMVILFSSGTTGKPKCIVHSAGGLLLQHRKEHVLHCDLSPGDTLFYYTTCGWMMWNWLITGLASGATIVTYDGNPAYPTLSRMPDLIDAEQITLFGTSAKFIDSCGKAGLKPRDTHSLSSLRAILSTGSPLLPQSFDYVYRDWKPDVMLASISGGTDICACFLGGIPVWPVRRGELQGPMLGMDVATLSPAGHDVTEAPGELVCRNAHLSMPVGFWNDDGRAYTRAYFARFANIWAHGDLAERYADGGFVILGRSDTTLNPGGVRIGTAEIYRQVEVIESVLESVAVGQDWEGDQRVVLFVRLRPETALTLELEAQIRARIRAGATPRHVPARIIAVPDIPRTRSGKISEAAVRDTIHNRPLGNDAALANAECLAAYRNLPELAR